LFGRDPAGRAVRGARHLAAIPHALPNNNEYQGTKMKKFALIVLAIIVISCKAYTVTPQSLKAQFENTVLSADNAFHAKQIQEISAFENDKSVTIKNSPSVEMWLTDLNGIGHYFYFNSLQLRNNVLIGDEIGFWRTHVRQIPIDSIQVATIKNGRKIQ